MLDVSKLQGTEKQIKWANDIRAKFLAELETEQAETIARKEKYDINDEKQARRFARASRLLEELAELEIWLKCKTNATFWINNRNYNLSRLQLSFAAEKEMAEKE